MTDRFDGIQHAREKLQHSRNKNKDDMVTATFLGMLGLGRQRFGREKTAEEHAAYERIGELKNPPISSKFSEQVESD
jgi:hypothetical protein